jgi:hypothetical protein
MVRTGDRAQWDPDHQLLFLGRAVGDELMHRGVDTPTIEAAVRECLQVDDVVVAASPEPNGALRVIAYVTDRFSGSIDFEAARLQLASTLPRWLAPEAVVQLDRLPLTPNGTLDRSGLPPCRVRTTVKRPPQTPLEVQLCTLFEEVLGVGNVALEDNFFELGGHSLLVSRLINRARTALGVELEIRTVFDAPSVAGLAERIAVIQ